MNISATVIISIMAFILGFAISKLTTKSNVSQDERTQLALLKKDSEELRDVKVEKKQLEDKANELNEEFIKVSAEYKSLQNQIKNQDEITKKIRDDFTLIANDVIKKEQEDLRKQNQESLELKLKPLNENLENFRKRIEEFNTNGEKNTEVLKNQIELLTKESNSIKNQAEELTNAIKINSQNRGVFGEIILEKLLKSSGLLNKKEDEVKGNYITQKSFRDLDNPAAHPQPDAVVFFPEENKNIVIDAKCPLKPYLEFTNTNKEEEQKQYIKEFYSAIELMIKDLSLKYNNLEGLHTPDFKLMFIPIEACFNYVSVNQDLIEKAAKSNILIVGPASLLATLKLINYMWSQKNQAANINEILAQASSIYDKCRTFIGKMEDVQKKFSTLQGSFDSVFTSIKGRGGLIGQIAKFKELGLSPANQIEEKYIDEENDDKLLVEVSENSVN